MADIKEFIEIKQKEFDRMLQYPNVIIDKNSKMMDGNNAISFDAWLSQCIQESYKKGIDKAIEVCDKELAHLNKWNYKKDEPAKTSYCLSSNSYNI